MNYLLLRGLGRQSGHWGEFKTQLQNEKFCDKVLALDLPGFGLKNTEDSPVNLRSITDNVRLDYLKNIKSSDGPWTILGFSLGGMVALDWVHRFPYDFKKIILINSSTANLCPPWKRLKLEAYTHFLKIIKSTNPKQREKEILKMICNHDPGAFVDEWVRLAKKHPYKESNVIKQLVSAISFRSADQIEIPGLVLTSKNDRMVHYECSKKIANHYNWPLKIHKTAGHDLTNDDPAWTITEIRQDFE